MKKFYYIIIVFLILIFIPVMCNNKIEDKGSIRRSNERKIENLYKDISQKKSLIVERKKEIKEIKKKIIPVERLKVDTINKDTLIFQIETRDQILIKQDSIITNLEIIDLKKDSIIVYKNNIIEDQDKEIKNKNKKIGYYKIGIGLLIIITLILI